MDYISVKEAAKNWGISERRIQKLCEEDRISGVFRFGRSWVIPKNTESQKTHEKTFTGGIINITATTF